MKIIEKKCPNCGANLDFEVGERDIQCGSCRRKFAVEYGDIDLDQLSKKAENALKAADISLRPARRMMVFIIIAFIVLAIVGTVISTISIINSRKRFDEQVEQSQREYEENSKEMMEQSQREYERRVQEMYESAE